MSRQDIKDWLDGVLRDFDKEAKLYDGKMFIDYKGHKLDVDEYIQIRVNEK